MDDKLPAEAAEHDVLPVYNTQPLSDFAVIYTDQNWHTHFLNNIIYYSTSEEANDAILYTAAAILGIIYTVLLATLPSRCSPGHHTAIGVSKLYFLLVLVRISLNRTLLNYPSRFYIPILLVGLHGIAMYRYTSMVMAEC